MYVLYEGTCLKCDLSVTIGLQRADPSEDMMIAPLREDLMCPHCGEHCQDSVFSVHTRKVVTDADMWEDEATAFLAQDKIVPAIRTCRTHTKTSLREAKRLVEALPAYADYKRRRAAV